MSLRASRYIQNLLEAIHGDMDQFTQQSEQRILDNISQYVPLILSEEPEWKDGQPHAYSGDFHQEDDVVRSLPDLIFSEINQYGNKKPGVGIVRKAMTLLRSLGVTVSNEDEGKYAADGETPSVVSTVTDNSGGRRKRRKTKKHKNKRKLRKTRKYRN
jgi:hypothetical protein